MIQLLRNNLKSGFNLAFLRSCPREAFAPSWHSIIFVFLLSVVVGGAADALATTAPRDFYIGGIEKYLAYFALLFLSACTASLLFADTEKTLRLATMLYNALFFPFLLFAGLYAAQIDFLLKENIVRDLNIIHWVWAFLITFRAVTLIFKPYPLRQMLASLAVLGGLFYLPAHYFYYDSFWYASYSEEEPSPLQEITHEQLFKNQDVLLNQKLAALKPARAGHTDVYGVVFGSFGYQDVFMREVGFVADNLSALDTMDGRILRMINNEKTLVDTPLAIETNLRAALKHLGGMMQKEDVLLLYITSHGGKDGTLSVHLNYSYRLNQINPALLAEILKESGIKNRIIFLSACYSGVMIDTLKNDDTLIMTSAAENRESYGCGDDSELTYFAEAYFKQAFPQEQDWVKGFAVAKTLMEQRENNEGKNPHSDPQIFIGKNIASRLPATLPKHWPVKPPIKIE